MVKLRSSWREALFLLGPVFKRGWAWIFFAQGISVLASLGMTVLQKYSEKNVILGIGILIVVQLILIVFGLVIVNQIIDDVKNGRPTTDLVASLRLHLKYVFINFARSILKILVGTFLLVPGLIFWVRFSFVPFVVMFDPHFNEGKIDALVRSENLVRGRFWPVFGVLILCVLFSIVPEFWLGSISPFEKPYSFTMVFFLGMWLELYGDVVTYCVFRKLERAA